MISRYNDGVYADDITYVQALAPLQVNFLSMENSMNKLTLPISNQLFTISMRKGTEALPSNPLK